MAQVSEKEFDERVNDNSSRSDKENERKSGGSFKFNVAAPEFVPSAAAAPMQVPITGYFYPCFQYIDGTNTGSWIYVSSDQELTIPAVPAAAAAAGKTGSGQNSPRQQQQQQQQAKDVVLSDEIKQKIIKQAEYMFSDMSMLANETLVKHVNKDPEGFVPMNFVSTLKKLKSLNINNQIVAQALRSSSKLVVSSDGKKVRRKLPFTDKEKEELQSRTVIAENLPDDHSHQKIEKMFNIVGTIKSIRICQPQDHNSSRSSKGDVVVSNKLHALVEYENAETAEKAAEKLNDERNWRKGMRVRVMLKRSVNAQPKSALKNRKSDMDSFVEDEGSMNQVPIEDASRLNTPEAPESEESQTALKRSWSRNRGKPKTRPQLQGARGSPTSAPVLGGSSPGQPIKGPRMPDGTRGFTMGRGKPIASPRQSTA